MPVDTEAFENLAAQVAELACQLEHFAEAERILARAGMPAPMRAIAERRGARHARDRHGLRLVRDGERR